MMPDEKDETDDLTGICNPYFAMKFSKNMMDGMMSVGITVVDFCLRGSVYFIIKKIGYRTISKELRDTMTILFIT